MRLIYTGAAEPESQSAIAPLSLTTTIPIAVFRVPLGCPAPAEVFLWDEKSVRSYSAVPVAGSGACTPGESGSFLQIASSMTSARLDHWSVNV